MPCLATSERGDGLPTGRPQPWPLRVQQQLLFLLRLPLHRYLPARKQHLEVGALPVMQLLLLPMYIALSPELGIRPDCPQSLPATIVQPGFVSLPKHLREVRLHPHDPYHSSLSLSDVVSVLDLDLDLVPDYP